MPPRQLALAALSMLELSPPDMVSCAATAGFSHVGLRLLPATAEEPQHDMLGNSPLLQQTLQRLQDTGVQVADVEILRLKPELDVASYLPMLESAARLAHTRCWWRATTRILPAAWTALPTYASWAHRWA